MIPISIKSQPPDRLYRAYKKESQRQGFLSNGIVVLRRLELYQTIEDAHRKDDSEGVGSRIVRKELHTLNVDSNSNGYLKSSTTIGNMHCSGSIIQPVYVFCTSSGSVDLRYLASCFNNNIIEIFDVNGFLESLGRSLSVDMLPGHHLLSASLLPVVYDKGEMGQEIESDFMEFCIAHKPPSFSKEMEWRIALVFDLSNENPPDCVSVSLGNTSAFARSIVA